MAGGLPAISGPELIKLLERDGWIQGRSANHGRTLTKKMRSGRTRVTFVPDKSNRSLPIGTLNRILGPQQTGIGRKGLERLLSM